MSQSGSRHFVTVGRRQIHYRRAGAGPPVVLLHQSPASSAELVPLLTWLAPRFTVFAPDMPGYGASDPLPDGVLRMQALVENLAAFLDALGIGAAALYGLHTGASLATAFACRHPHRVVAAIAEGLLCLDGGEREELLRRYLEPFVPRWDGGHLAWLWSRLKDQSVFFPWYDRSPESRLGIDAAPTAGLAAKAEDWLRSGEHYWQAYAAAMAYEPRADLSGITTPHYVLCQGGDPLSQHLQRLPSLPANVRVQTLPDGAARDSRLLEILLRHCAGVPAPHVVPTRPIDGGSWYDYVGAPGAQLRILRAVAPDSQTARPIVVQHDAQSSLRACRDLVTGCASARTAIAVELPGHGESDPAAMGGEGIRYGHGHGHGHGHGDEHEHGDEHGHVNWADGGDADRDRHRDRDRDAGTDGDADGDDADGAIGDAAQRVAATLANCGIDSYDWIGLGAGATIGAQLLRHAPRSMHTLTLIAPLDLSQDLLLRTALIDSYSAPRADSYGGYLLRAWHEVRDHQLFFPWFERRRACAATGAPCLDPAWLHERTVELLQSGAQGVALRRAELAYPLLRRLAAAAVPHRFAAPLWEPRFAQVRDLAGAAGSFLQLGPQMRAWPTELGFSSDR